MASFTLLGTSSCEGIPAPFCRCPLCTKARRDGGKDRRRRFSVLVDGHIMVDFGPDAAWQFCEFKVDETKIDTICVTHSHVDHFDALDLIWRDGYDVPAINLIANDAVKQSLYKLSGEIGSKKVPEKINLIKPTPGIPVESHGAVILPIRATHCEDMECALNYLITTKDGKKLFILSDTGWWRDESFEQVKNANADAAVIEMSYGIHPPYDTEQRQHLGTTASMAFLDKLKELKALKENARCVTAHISHCSNTTHAELENFFADKPLKPGYDGLTVDF